MSELQANSPSSSPCWKDKYEMLLKHHNEVDNLIEELERLSSEQKDEALKLYIRAISLIDIALAEPLVCPENPDLSWERAGVMVQKLKKLKKDLMGKVANLQTNDRNKRAADEQQSNPPSYEEAMGLPSTSQSDASNAKTQKTLNKRSVIVHVPRTYRELAEALQQLEVRQWQDGTQALFPTDMTNVEMVEQEAEVLFSHDNVQLYFINPNGEVTCSTDPLHMQIVRLSGNLEGNAPPAYLQVGNWVYPLVPGLSPVFHADNHAFILPDVHSLVEGAAVGIMLPEDSDEDALELLVALLKGNLLDAPLADTRPMAAMARARRAAPRSSIMTSMVRGAQYIRDNLIRGAEHAGSALNNSTPYVLSKLEKENPKEVNPSVSQGLKIAKDVSGKAVTVSSFVASKLSAGTMALGRFLAPHVQKQGTRLLSYYVDEREAENKVKSMLQFTAGAVEALGTVYSGLEEASRILSSSIANNTVIVVKHKYGNQAGEAVNNSFATIGNVMTVTHTVNKLTPKGVVKITAKEAGKAVISDQRNKFREEAAASNSSDKQKEDKIRPLANEVD